MGFAEIFLFVGGIIKFFVIKGKWGIMRKVPGKIVDYWIEKFLRNGNYFISYYPVFEYEFNGKTYTAEDEINHFFPPQIGRIKTLKIDPKHPNRVRFPSINWANIFANIFILTGLAIFIIIKFFPEIDFWGFIGNKLPALLFIFF